MKTVLLSSLLAVALSSGAALAGNTHHMRHESASFAQADHRFYSVYRGNPVNPQTQSGSSATYSVDPSPVSDQ